MPHIPNEKRCYRENPNGERKKGRFQTQQMEWHFHLLKFSRSIYIVPFISFPVHSYFKCFNWCDNFFLFISSLFFMCVCVCAFLFAHKQRLMHSQNNAPHNKEKKLELVPCCTATQFSSLDLLYVESNTTATRKTLPNMVVEACGCMWSMKTRHTHTQRARDSERATHTGAYKQHRDLRF